MLGRIVGGFKRRPVAPAVVERGSSDERFAAWFGQLWISTLVKV
jgi:hypothetical protein